MIKDYFSEQNIPYMELPQSGESSRFGRDDLRSVSAIQVGAGSTVMRADKSGLWLGAAKYINAPFKIDMLGNVIASSLTITGGTITGATIQTATTGQRVVIAAADNTLRFKDSTGNDVIAIGTGGGIASSITLNSTTSIGFVISSSVAGVGFQYDNNGNVASYGLKVNLSHSSNQGICVDLINAGASGAYGINMAMSNGAKGILMSKSGTGNALEINNSGSGNAISITQSGGADGLTILNSSTDTTKSAIVATRSGQGKVGTFNSTYNSTGNKIAISTNISGNSTNAYGFEFVGYEIVASSSLPAGGVIGVVKVLCTGLSGSPIGYIPIYGA
jgi:hypothetical protein